MTDYKKEKSQVYQYDTSADTIGGDLLNFKKLLVQRNPEKWDYQIDGFRYVPESVHDLDKISALVNRSTKEVQIRVYFGANSNNCVTYIYKFAPSQQQPSLDTPLFGGLGNLTSSDALQKHENYLKMGWETEKKDTQIAELQAKLKDVEGKYAKTDLLLAQKEEEVEKLNKQLASPVPPMQAFFASLAGGVMDKVAEFSGVAPPQGYMPPPQQGLGNLPPELANIPIEVIKDAVQTMQNLAEDFGENMEKVWDLVGALQEKQGYIDDLTEFTEKYAHQTRRVIDNFDQQVKNAQQ